MDNLALVYPEGSGTLVAHARGVDLMVGGGTDNFTGGLLLAPTFEMVFEIERDILRNNKKLWRMRSDTVSVSPTRQGIEVTG